MAERAGSAWAGGRGAVAVGFAAVLLAVVLLWLGGGRQAAAVPQLVDPGDKGGVVAVADGWKEIERLVGEQKFEEAARRAATLREAAQRTGDEEQWTRALVKEVQLRTGLHGYETAVRFLSEQSWPRGAVHRAVLDLFLADAMVTYLQAYSWEIHQRERVESGDAVDLKAWTEEQIAAKAREAFERVWAGREELGAAPVARFAEYLSLNSYPAEVRGTMRDAVTYLYAALLADSSTWTPEQSEAVSGMAVAELLADAAPDRSPSGQAGQAHPLVRLVTVLADLEAWHHARAEAAGELEARLERTRRVHGAFSDATDREKVRKDLEQRLAAFHKVEWWAMGQAELADLLRQEDRPDNEIAARSAAQAGLRAYPKSIGGQRCRHIIAAIESPDYRVASMAVDGPARRSIEVTHRNLERLYLRAWRQDLSHRLAEATDYNLLPRGDEVRAIMAGSPAATWTATLAATPDYRLHRTFVTPPPLAPGLYLVAASARADFAPTANEVVAVHLLVTDLVILSRLGVDGGVDVDLVSGRSGAGVAGAEVTLYRYDWRQGHHPVARRRTGAAGEVRFPATALKLQASHFLVASKDGDTALDPDALTRWERGQRGETTASLVFTDRSVYRPQQRILWKVLAYRDGGAGRLAVAANEPVTLALIDANGDEVESRTVASNEFGSAAGEFTIPGGRLLGAWTLRSSLSGSATVRVEEYKRPTFEVAIKEPAAALRLNRSAALRGEARYYFGLPVTSGSVRWRALREPVRPWWWWFDWKGGRPRTVASGRASLASDGSFELAFTPAADERSGRGVSYRFRVIADVTDEGGETRSGERVFRLGFVALEPRIDFETAFAIAGEPVAAAVRREDLDGLPRPGEGRWQLVALLQPAAPLLPADEPRDGDGEEAEGAVRTPGDELRPRWDTRVAPDAVLRRWRDGREVARGQVRHEAAAVTVALPTLTPGAYRLRYETSDEFGASVEVERTLVVAGRQRTDLALPAILEVERGSVPVGGVARALVHSGFPGQPMVLDVVRDGRPVERRRMLAGTAPTVVEFPVTAEQRGGFSLRLTVVRDHQLLEQTRSVAVPWEDRELKVAFSTFRDTLRPGVRELWRIRVSDPAGKPVEAKAAEVLASMYDKSLDLFAPHLPPHVLSLYPTRTGLDLLRSSLGSTTPVFSDGSFPLPPSWPSLQDDELKFLSGYAIGGPGRRGMKGGVMMQMAAPMAMREELAGAKSATTAAPQESRLADKDGSAAATAEQPPALRSDFAETAFWFPQLLTDADGSVTLEFKVPDSVTAWDVWVQAVTKDLRAGSLRAGARSVKELMVRPYLPRFLREGDRLELRVAVDNASARDLAGEVRLVLTDPASGAAISDAFGLGTPADGVRRFSVKAGAGTTVVFPLAVPPRPGTVAFTVTAAAGDLSDGELRALPVLPGRMHLTQSRFVTLREGRRRTMSFPDLARCDDPTRINDSLVVTVDAQLFYAALSALPYLVNYPYECTEQTLNRFVSTGILSGLFQRYPAVAKMAEQLARRETRLETWDAADPNRRMALEETPWLVEARGGGEKPEDLVRVLDARVARAEREASLAKLGKAQTASGGFPWWPGGPPSPYMTLYIMYGLAKAAEFGIEVPRDMVEEGWAYLTRHFRDELVQRMMKDDCCWEFLTFLNYVASCYGDPAWMGDALTPDERRQVLDFSFRHWRQHSPYLKGLLALTLKRMGRPGDAGLVFDSVMDSAKTTEDGGTFWAPEDRAWLWYNDTVETHAFALRTLTELAPQDPRKDGLVQWLLLDKKMNHWKSTRATAEALYALAHVLAAEGAIGARETVTVTAAGQRTEFTFAPDRYTGAGNRVVVPGDSLGPDAATVVAEKTGKGIAFASATWHFSTEQLPEQGDGDLFAVSRQFFKRELVGREAVLRPLAPGVALLPGDEIEVQLSLRSRHGAEYVHLRDPRPAGCEPVSLLSQFKWALGIGWYEEVRDSGTNFFFEQLPQGEFTFKYRLRVATAGTFRVAPATVQSMYAPEFNAYSAGAVLTVGAEAAVTK
jgi:uncharacterized protein YfaS (alpha-2-macroglobulin family)